MTSNFSHCLSPIPFSQWRPVKYPTIINCTTTLMTMTEEKILIINYHLLVSLQRFCTVFLNFKRYCLFTLILLNKRWLIVCCCFFISYYKLFILINVVNCDFYDLFYLKYYSICILFPYYYFWNLKDRTTDF